VTTAGGVAKIQVPNVHLACGVILKSPQPFGWGLFHSRRIGPAGCPEKLCHDRKSTKKKKTQPEHTPQPSSAWFLGWQGWDLAHEG
jgi:hypothetical protein